MRVLLGFDPKMDQNSKIARLLAETIRRETGAKVTQINLLEKSPNLASSWDQIVLFGNIWKGHISESLKEIILENSEIITSLPITVTVSSYLEDLEFKKVMVNDLGLALLENLKVSKLGMNVSYNKLSPLDKIWWKLSRQKVATKFSRSQLKGISEFSL